MFNFTNCIAVRERRTFSLLVDDFFKQILIFAIIEHASFPTTGKTMPFVCADQGMLRECRSHAQGQGVEVGRAGQGRAGRQGRAKGRQEGVTPLDLFGSSWHPV